MKRTIKNLKYGGDRNVNFRQFVEKSKKKKNQISEKLKW